MRALKLTALAIGLVLFAASCKNTMELTKRHYTKGYYFHKTNTPEQPAVNEGVASKHSDVKSTDLEKVTPSLPTTSTPELKKHQETPVATAFGKKEEKSPKKEAAHGKQEVEKKSLEQLVVSDKKQEGSYVQQKNAQAKGGDAGMNLVILIILCFLSFLNLIAIYVHDGHSITTNFWVTLLLDFTFIGGIIFSLLVILDIVDLS